ncbi:MAG: IS1 family transposase [Nitrosopumilaceae archaeon]|nr:IS1 family transposase [Nitrosopumilaceae archaeon]
MNKSPIRNSTGDIGCPRCFISLKKDNTPFKMYGEFVGNFESYVCPMCNYSVLTENGYDNAMIQAKQLAINQDIPNIRTSEFHINSIKIGINDQKIEQIHKNKQEIQSTNEESSWEDIENELIGLEEQPLQVNLFTKKTRD